MVRAIMNVIGVQEGEVLLDPMCGSGTVNLEAVLCGIDTIGVDFHPLFTNITKIKIDSLTWDIEWLRHQIEGLLRDIRLNIEAEVKAKTLSSFILEKRKSAEIFLPKSLMRGINEDSLHCVEIIKGCIRDLENKELQEFCELALAYWIRSMLKKQTVEKIIETYSQRLWSMFFALHYFWKFKHEVSNFKLGKHLVYTGDVRELERVIRPGLEYFGKDFVDAIVTSPPYGTAIDYLSEHVYALYALDLTKDHLKLDEQHIGSPRVELSMVREITSKSDEFLNLPASAQSVLMKMVKFGRKAKAAAFYKYFVDMLQAFKQMYNVLADGKFLVMIIGKEQTIKLGAENGIIDLGAIMEDMGKSVGLTQVNSIDIGLRKASERGAIPTEHIIFFKKSI
jgi:DNA modification methylase